MLKFLFTFLCVFIIYYLFLKIYIKTSNSLKENKNIKNNYIVKNILLSSKQNIDFFDLVVVFIITYFTYYR
ncbi:hypothetical protein HNQ45_000752 [Nosocomiicoccus ampullae]|uniref:Uncharacterized protein n=1 Tax=Nosocomiicoccus ampullae TaxID=489910 RepID=A0A9Q2CZM8_9STAP|nr:hypothetical protein [Nosocomiicoccus ampullae]